MKNTGGTRSHAPKYIGIFVLLLILLCALPLVASAKHTCVDFEDQDYPDYHMPDHLCDICGVKMTECGVDELKKDATAGQDHLCDICYKYLSNLCVDNDGDDHLCDICYKYLSNLCVDNDETPHRCDVCNRPMENGKDKSRAEFKGLDGSNNPYHIFWCTKCGEWHEEWHADCNKEGKNLSLGEQGGGYKHAAVYCSICKHYFDKDVEPCVDDTIKDHKCDKCKQVISSCADGNSDHYCDHANCGLKLSDCVDNNRDGKCDICGAILHLCSDSHDMDEHLCDDPDCSLTASGFCWDNGDADHECNECGQVLLNDCVDDDKDHYCDFCPIQLTTCNDARDDIDHLCDMCGGEVDNPEPCWDNTSLELDVDGHTCNAIGCGKKIDPSVKDFCWDYDGDGKCEECGWVIGSEPLPALRPEYRITVNGSDGKVERINETSIVHEVLYVRMSLGYEVSGQSYAVVALLKVDWAEGQVGKLGYFTVPNVQGSGARTGASYLAMIDSDADDLTISGAVKDSYGMLIQ